MAKPTGDIRKLWYPLDKSLVSQADTPSVAIENFPFQWPTNDSDEPVSVVLELSLNEYIALSSSVDVGSDIAYGENAILIWFIWVRSLYTMDFCDRVDDCITANPTTQTLINNLILNTGTSNPNSIIPDVTMGSDRIPEADTEPISTAPPLCDNDALWAGIREMVDRLDQNGRDVIEDLAVINDKIEQIFEAIDLVPILGDFVKDVSDFFTEEIPDILNAYNAASSPTFLDNLACDLFEMVCSECRYPTFDEVFQIIASRSLLGVPSSILATNYVQSWNLIKGIAIGVPEPVWYTINLWQCMTLLYGGNFGRTYGKDVFSVWASFGEDNPNNNWEILCSGCDDSDAIPATGNGFSGAGNIFSMVVPPNSTVRIEYLSGQWDMNTGWSGSWAGDPDTQAPTSLVPGANIGALVARDPDNAANWVYIADDYTFNVVSAVNELFITANDVEGGFSDNSGALLVRITVTPN